MSSDELIGKTLGQQYDIQAVLGKGGMSTVYLAHQRNMDRKVAVKVLPREFLHDEAFLQRFQQETRTIARLEHPHILPVYDAGEDQGVPYIVMRYLSGGSVADLVRDHLPDNAIVARIVTEIAGALDYAHARNIIHRDIKPSNILLDSAGHAYLADFGIARAMQEASGLTGSRVIGTPTYIAPEQVQKGQPVTYSVDIYALGIVVFEMLTGAPPFYDDDPTKTMMAHVLEPVPSARDVDPTISPAVDAVLRRVLAKNPRDRYASAGEFAQALSVALGVTPVDMRGTAGSPLPRSAPIIPPPPGHGYGGGARGVEPREVYPPPTPGYEYYEEYELRPRRGGCAFPVWLIVPGVILALFGGVLLTAYILTDGDLRRLILPFESANSGSENPLPGLPTDNEGPVPTFRPAVLPPPSGGDRLAFASNRTGNFDIYIIDIDGANLTPLTDQPGPDFYPAWSPDGTQILYVSREDLESDAHIWIMDADGTNKRQITEGDDDNTNPDWSPDGQWIAFASNRDGDYEIYLMHPDGSEVIQITDNNVQDLWPRWTPDGALLAYHSRPGNQSSASELFYINSFGGTPTQLTNNSAIDQWPDWSPEGLRLAYSSGQGLSPEQHLIYMRDFGSGQDIQVTELNPDNPNAGNQTDEDPAWSPDGGRIAFDSNRDGENQFDLYVIDLNSRRVEQLTDDAGDNVTPVWQPRR